MFRLVFIPFVLVPVFYGHKAASAGTTGAAETISCLSEMNVERAAAGLAAFEEATDGAQVLPKTPAAVRDITPATLWTEICKIITKEGTESAQAKQLTGTFAYYRGENDCKAAVQYWKDGFSLFKNELPPAYKALNDPQIYTEQAVSFVALYNPQTSPVASCAFVTCTTAAGFTSPDGGSSTRRLQGEEDTPSTTTAVICLTNPKALTAGEPPFKEEVWQKIVQAIVGTEESNGASPVRPSFAVGFIMMLFAYGLF
ncbi:SAG family member [Eimeria necatrix]|uniref:SAG family member n=1 Tax=Eimeria necatrix TaxID=51315 RepID=U6MF82_9EIME|nr:SAG family member [Eimeria necatrix]CDJ62907.1 SAG family member [Eimeria necatrix]